MPFVQQNLHAKQKYTFSLVCLTQLVQWGDSWTVLKFLDVLQITKMHAEKFIGIKMHSQWIFFF